MPDPAQVTDTALTQLAVALQGLDTNAAAPDPNIVIAGGTYNFVRAGQQFFRIGAQGVTIRAKDGESVVLKNLQLQIDPDSANDIVIQDIAFRSDGGFVGNNPKPPRDCILFLSSGGTPPSPETRTRITVRITHCSFDGYFDMSIDSNVIVGRPILYVTIDRCLFFDDFPGDPRNTIPQNNKNVRGFVNRGAINISSKVHDGVGNSLFVISNCVFIDIWRRIPRVAQGNTAILYNNLMFRWGVGNNENDSDNGTNEWTGVVTDNDGRAIVLRNRFIPWRKKTEVADTIDIGPDTTVDVGNPRAAGTKADGTPIPPRADLTNEFDGADGARLSTQPSISRRRVQVIDLDALYRDLKLTGVTPPTPGTITNWMPILLSAGPPRFDSLPITATLASVLANAAAGRPTVPRDPPT